MLAFPTCGHSCRSPRSPSQPRFSAHRCFFFRALPTPDPSRIECPLMMLCPTSTCHRPPPRNCWPRFTRPLCIPSHVESVSSVSTEHSVGLGYKRACSGGRAEPEKQRRGIEKQLGGGSGSRSRGVHEALLRSLHCFAGACTWRSSTWQQGVGSGTAPKCGQAPQAHQAFTRPAQCTGTAAPK